jgi:hypothetical protein
MSDTTGMIETVQQLIGALWNARLPHVPSLQSNPQR